MADPTIPVPTKTCTRCRASKTATPENFYRESRGLHGLSAVCKPCREDHRRAASWPSDTGEAAARGAKAYRERNLEKARAAGRARYHRDRERNSALALAYYHSNKPTVREYNRAKYRKRPDHRVRVSISAGMRRSIKSGKAGRSWESLVGYTLDDLMAHLGRQFVRGMTWENYGPAWHIDHIVPVVSFGPMEPGSRNFLACWALTNLRPMWATGNLQKGGRRDRLL